jgi:hypothetical protein
VAAGGSTTIIAGSSIKLMDGTTVQADGYLHAFITTDGTYCGQQAKQGDTPEEELAATGSFFKVYPNPTSGAFTVEINGDETITNARVMIYSMMGKKIGEVQMGDNAKKELSIAGQTSGIYLISVVKDDKAGTVKIIRK